MNSSDAPRLSVVVIIASDTAIPGEGQWHLLDNCLNDLTNQADAPVPQIIVPYVAEANGIEPLLAKYGDVEFIPVSKSEILAELESGRKYHDQIKAIGLLHAKGEIVGLLEDNGIPDEHWCARTLESHKQDYVAIGGAIENGRDRLLNWALYYCDFGRYQAPLDDGESPFASDANISYKRSALEAVRSVLEKGYNELTLHEALKANGGRLALDSSIVVYQQRSIPNLRSALKERYVWGRSFGVVRSGTSSKMQRVVIAAVSPLIPLIGVLKIFRTVLQKRRNFSKFLKAFPLIVVLLITWAVGEMMGHLTAHSADEITEK